MAAIETDNTVDGAGASPSTNGLLGRLKAKRTRIRETRTLDLDVDGYNGDLVARYKVLPWEELRKIGNRMEKSKHPKKELVSHADTIANACIGLYAREGGKLVPLEQALKLAQDHALVYGPALAAALDFPADNARQAVFGLFNDEIAVTVHHNELMEWMQTTDREDDEDFVGESGGTQ